MFFSSTVEMTSPICRIVTMYRIAWKNIKTGYTDHGDFSMSLKEAGSSIESLKKVHRGIIYWIESEDCEITFERPS